jgi:glycosyltransferase involved in cell wall biosynthesis
MRQTISRQGRNSDYAHRRSRRARALDREKGMKICIITGIFPPDIGGPATYVSTLADYLYSIGWSVEIVTYTDSSEPIESPFPIHTVPRNQSTIKKYLMTRKLVKEVAARSDLAYINGLLIPAASALVKRKIPKVAKIVGDPVWERAQNKGLTNQDFDEFRQSRQPLKIRLLQHLRDRSLRRMDKIIVPSEYLRQTVAGWGFGDKVKIIFNGITKNYGHEFLNLSTQEAKKHLGISGWLLLSVGRLCRWKGFAAIIRSLKQLEQDIKLVIVGDGPQQEELLDLAHKENVSKRVAFAGRVSHDRLPLYLRAADSFILNSGYEGFPHIILEAMAMQCPVIAANRCGTPELIKDGFNGILVEKDNLNEIARAVRRIREDSAFGLSLVQNGQSNAKAFTWDITAENTVRLFEDMV